MLYLEHETSTVSSTLRTFVLLHASASEGGTAGPKQRDRERGPDGENVAKKERGG
jgi:hypothetical protein